MSSGTSEWPTYEPHLIAAMNEPNPNTAAAAFKRPKPPQPPLFIPPGHVAFRILCHASRIGGLIGKSGSIIKQLQQLTNSRIRVEDPPDSSDNRIISVVASPIVTKQIQVSAFAPNPGEEGNGGAEIDGDGDEIRFDVSAAQEGAVKVFERVVEVAADGDAVAGIDGVVSCRLLVSKNQGGAVIGKGGKVVEKIRKETGCRIKVLPVETTSDEIVEIEGVGLAVKKALIAVTCRLQEFPPPEKTRTYPTRPIESESLPIQTVELPLQRSSISQPTPLSYINYAPIGSAVPVFEKFSHTNSIAPPQEVSFKILCPNDRVGCVIGKGGAIINSIQNETGASIDVASPVAECDERLITITAMESVESEHSPAQKATIAVFRRSVGPGLVKGFGPDSRESPVSARVLVAPNQVGCLLGKGGAIISEMRKMTSTSIWIIGADRVPKCASENEVVLEIIGELYKVQAALYKVTGRLRDNTFSAKMLSGNRNHNSLSKTHEPKSLTQRMDHLAISTRNDQSPSTQMADSGLNQGNIMATGSRFATEKGGALLDSGSRDAVVSNTMTVEIAIPDAAIGSDSSDFDTLRQISGAQVVVQEPHPGTTQRTVVISGTPDEVQAAQSLLQAFILAG